MQVTNLNVVTITSSVDYASGSNVFGTNITDRQVFTGSIYLTGSINFGSPGVNNYTLLNWNTRFGAGSLSNVSTNGLLLNVSTSGGATFTITNSDNNLNIVFPSTGYVQIGRNAGASRLYGPDEGGILEIRTANNVSQSLKVYNTYTSATNYERLGFNWTQNVARIYTETGSAGGSVRQLVLGTNSLPAITIDTNQAIVTSGSLVALAGVTGSLLGTSSYALQALSASYSLTASYIDEGFY